MTDYRKWRLVVDHGRQTWSYLKSVEEEDKWPQSTADKYFLGLNTGNPVLPQPKTLLDCARNGFDFFASLQLEDGHWGCEYGGPMFLIPGMVIAAYITGTKLPEEWGIEITRYLVLTANKVDGGWGLHVEHHSTVFGTSCNYVALRLLGMDVDHPVATRARATLHRLGGAIGNPQWGKFWLAVLNCYEWSGLNPVPPELWLLPEFVPVHPWRWWIHTRNVFIPMSYLYAKKFQAPVDDLIRSLREELYTQPYHSIDFTKHRNTVASADLYCRHSKLMDYMNVILVQWEKYLMPSLIKNAAIARVYDLIKREDENTDYLCVGPVNQAIHLLAVWVEEGPSYAFRRHEERLADFMFLGKNGMMMNGTNGVQLWDTAFAVQAAVESGLVKETKYHSILCLALGFLDDTQIRENCKDPHLSYRHDRKGAWPFSTRHQGYTVSDCTAEGLKSVLALQQMPNYPKVVSEERLQDAVDVLLTLQNKSGGFASYECIRGPQWLELLNPAEVFGNIMVEYDYPECTTAVVTGLCMFRKSYPNYRTAGIQNTIARAVDYIRASQRLDGSWYGSWGICFTYASMFALESLASVGDNYESSALIRKACRFLVERQEEDGGWSESYKSCELGVYSRQQKSQLTNTSWALIALMHAKFPDRNLLCRGIMNLRAKQQPNGEWLPESIEGVFNKNW